MVKKVVKRQRIVSKTARQRMKRMTAGERKQVMKAARLLADNEVLSDKRYAALARLNKSCSNY